MSEKKSKLAIIKTKPTLDNVEDFINKIEDLQKRDDSFTLVKIMKDASKEDPVLWGSSIIGFGLKRFKSPATGREVDWLLIGFAPRKANLSLHLCGSLKIHSEAFVKLGKYKLGVGCIYINKLADIDLNILTGIIEVALKQNVT
jgi:hypothetical protein